MLNPDFHDAANEFPMFDVGRFSELVSDICEHGQRETIKLYRGKVLDGRNRYKACIELGIEPRTEALPDDIDPWAYVWSLNGQRRDISNEVRTLIGLSCLEKSAALAAELQRIQDEANAKRSEVARARSREEDGTFHPVVRQVDAPLAPKPVPVRSSEVKAKFLKTNSSAVERMTRLEEKRPDLARQVKTGALPASRAMQATKVLTCWVVGSISSQHVTLLGTQHHENHCDLLRQGWRWQDDSRASFGCGLCQGRLRHGHL